MEMLDLNRAKDTNFSKKRSLNIHGSLLSIDKPWVMGILNITPDSFFDGGQHDKPSEALLRCKQMLDEGADIIDIGASSSRPGATLLSAKDEIARLSPILKNIKTEFPEALLSVDTFYSEVAKAAVDLGAHIINDISGGKMDPAMAKTMAQLDVPYVMMHMLGTPQNMQNNPEYQNVTMAVSRFLSQQIKKFMDAGVSDLILDPGFGFGKTVEHNYQLLNHLEILSAFEKPILVGFSRKSMINKVLGTKPENALNGTTILNTMALQKGADILRVHDVKQAKEAVKIVTFAQTHS